MVVAALVLSSVALVLAVAVAVWARVSVYRARVDALLAWGEAESWKLAADVWRDEARRLGSGR
jgi:hypothetical protein